MTKFKLLPLALIVGLVVIFVTLVKPIIVPNDDIAAGVVDYSGMFDDTADTGVLGNSKVNVPLKDLAQVDLPPKKVLGESSSSNKWIEVSLSQQHLWAWDGGQLYLDTPVSTGLPWFPTPTGEFRIWTKLRYVHMVGGTGAYYYNLPNVPFVMFFNNDQIASWRGFSLHGTYWHNDFGKVHSHGCVNLPTPMAEKIYYWATPELPAGKSSVPATADNPGTRIVIHG